MVSLRQKLKMLKTCEKLFVKNLVVVLCKKTPANIREMRQFLKSPSCKGYSPGKDNSLIKIVSLCQKLKMPKTCQELFYKNILVVFCKKTLKKTANIREMRQF